MQVNPEAGSAEQAEFSANYSHNMLTTIVEQNHESCTPNMIKQSSTHLLS